jgi:hypothetical protein
MKYIPIKLLGFAVAALTGTLMGCFWLTGIKPEVTCDEQGLTSFYKQNDCAFASVPRTFKELYICQQEGRCNQFEERYNAKGHSTTNYSLWWKEKAVSPKASLSSVTWHNPFLII